jgi:hypothetical protein
MLRTISESGTENSRIRDPGSEKTSRIRNTVKNSTRNKQQNYKSPSPLLENMENMGQEKLKNKEILPNKKGRGIGLQQDLF